MGPNSAYLEEVSTSASLSSDDKRICFHTVATTRMLQSQNSSPLVQRGRPERPCQTQWFNISRSEFQGVNQQLIAAARSQTRTTTLWCPRMLSVSHKQALVAALKIANAYYKMPTEVSGPSLTCEYVLVPSLVYWVFELTLARRAYISFYLICLNDSGMCRLSSCCCPWWAKDRRDESTAFQTRLATKAVCVI